MAREMTNSMLLSIVKYGHPVLRKKGARIERITPEIERLILDMLETMRIARGVGLAAQQVGHALQLAIVDVTGVVDRPSTLHLEGQPATVESFMPVVLINPEIQPAGESMTGPEGCLSFPEIYADIDRSEFVEVKAQDDRGKPISFRAGGLLARAVQHEVDHLNGILFIDRMETATRRELKAELESLQMETKTALQK
jgi:peptide deformylase